MSVRLISLLPCRSYGAWILSQSGAFYKHAAPNGAVESASLIECKKSPGLARSHFHFSPLPIEFVSDFGFRIWNS